MQILINSNNSVKITESFIQKASTLTQETLNVHADRLTRVEIYFMDVNSDKSGPNDKSCSIEARIKGLEPMAATHQAPSIDEALMGGLDKLSRVLGRSLDKMDHKKGRTPMGGEPFADMTAAPQAD